MSRFFWEMRSQETQALEIWKSDSFRSPARVRKPRQGKIYGESLRLPDRKGRFLLNSPDNLNHDHHLAISHTLYPDVQAPEVPHEMKIVGIKSFAESFIYLGNGYG